MEHQPAAESSRAWATPSSVSDTSHKMRSSPRSAMRRKTRGSLRGLGDAEKRRALRKKYRGTRGFSYDEYDECLRSPKSTPFTLRAAQSPALRLRRAGGPGGQAHLVRKADGRHRGRVPQDDRCRPGKSCPAHDCLSSSLRAGESDGH